jgi:hypothetical protein
MELTSAQQVTVSLVYISTILPLLAIIALQLLGKLPRWILLLYVAGFVACAVGWEIWLTYGLVDGLDVNSRRSPALVAAIPQNINWILNSLGDTASIGLVGVLLIWLCFGRTDRAFVRWHWGAFTLLLFWFVGQNLFVELYIYQEQLAEGFRLSWAPLMPTGPWYNPILFKLDGRSVQLQTQLPLFLMAPIYYGMLIYIYRRFKPIPGDYTSSPAV